ncbi:hypothetical protein LSM04_009390 [Trypanosoma melophagium]|uniref:uncharacterized protein n=1 Tax=Trypanosoma melophagium TaxID=715481 RepID=UPI00351A2D8A|nr:hypothetical protein LSM04_009390 [Trypanosoma melophagium]
MGTERRRCPIVHSSLPIAPLVQGNANAAAARTAPAATHGNAAAEAPSCVAICVAYNIRRNNYRCKSLSEFSL